MCGFILQTGHIGNGCLSASFCVNMNVGWDILFGFMFHVGLGCDWLFWFHESGRCLLFLCSGCVGYCEVCIICDAFSWRCSFMGSMCVSSCRCVMQSVVHPLTSVLLWLYMWRVLFSFVFPMLLM